MANIVTTDKFPAGTPNAAGEIEQGPDGRVFMAAYWDATAPSTCSKGDAVFVTVDFDGTTALTSPQIAAAATISVAQIAGIVCATLTAAGLVWVQIQGRNDFTKVDGTTDVGIGDTLQMVNGQVYLVQDSASAISADSLAIALEAETDTIAAQGGTAASASHSIYLFNRLVTIG